MMGPRCLRILSILLLLSTLTTAWPWPRWLPELDTLVVRQDSKDDGNQASSTSDSSTPKQTEPPTSSDSKSGSKTDSQTDSQTTDKAESTSYSVSLDIHTVVSAGKTFVTTERHTITPRPSPSKGASSTTTKHKTFDPVLPAGSISMISPAVILGPQYYKIDNNITFEFAYTNVLATPTALNVMATCSVNSHMYTIAMNHTVANSTGTVVWDTGKYQETGATKLLTQTYTLIIYDADSSISATSEAGYLAPFNQYSFGMYLKQKYSDYNDDYHCATCLSGGMSHMERMTLTTVLGVSIITVLSFTWFVGGLGITL